MKSLGLMLARFCLSAWIGAAALFVVTSISEQVSTAYGSDVKNVLAAIRFPWYYGFGFSLVGLSLIGGLIGVDRVRQPRRWRTLGVCLALALVLMTVDYVAIYSPLRDIVTNPSGVRDARFQELHRWSEQINTVDVTLCLIAAIAVCWPNEPHQPLNPNP